MSADEAADVLAQSVACALPIFAAMPARRRAVDWLLDDAAPWERFAIEVAADHLQSATSTLKLSAANTLRDVAHLYEPFLHNYGRQERKRRGVYFTPRPIADFVVRQADQALSDDFHLADGLSADCGLSTSSRCPGVQEVSLPLVVDPSAGTGVFLLAVIDHVVHRVQPNLRVAGRSHGEYRDRWNAFVPQLLSRLVGVEILPAAALLAKLNIAAKLAETGYRFEHRVSHFIHCADALDRATLDKILNAMPETKARIPVFLGNPPFSSLTTHSNPWIARLVRGDEHVRGYVRAGRQRLGERKTWLHDDYVKFLRLAQWHVEQAGVGIVGFVTNRGYLDNATFRLMRHELLRVFPRIQIVDLHGSRKAGDVAPGGGRDENVFSLDQGVAIGLFCRPPKGSSVEVQDSPLIREEIYSPVSYVELWGDRAAKLQALADPSLPLRHVAFTPAAPRWQLVPPAVTAAACPDYESAWPLIEAMPASASAPVTARDRFVVASSREELCERIVQFRDLSIPDEAIRERYFTRTRSSRYPPGDTRGWKLALARRIVAADNAWQGRIVRCLYRPFDWRWVFWHPAMIDWPRAEITRHLLPSGGNSDCEIRSSEKSLQANPSEFCIYHTALCLIARRQQLASQPCSFFWISDGLALDGVIRSDNRGSETLFPLYLYGGEGTPSSRRANFAPAFVTAFEQVTKLAWQPLGRGDLRQAFGPEDLLSYVYALFHSPRYRERYADALRHDFPRVLLPSSVASFLPLVAAGRELIALHTLQHAERSLARVAEPEVESFRIGGYVALRKWLQPSHRSERDREYAQIASAIRRTIEIMAQIDSVNVCA